MVCLLSHFRFDGNFNANVSKTISCDRLSPTVNSRAFNPGRDLNFGVYARTHTNFKSESPFSLSQWVPWQPFAKNNIAFLTSNLQTFFISLMSETDEQGCQMPDLDRLHVELLYFLSSHLFSFPLFEWTSAFLPFLSALLH